MKAKWFACLIALLMCSYSFELYAQNAGTSTTAGETDAGSLIDKSVVDNKGDTVGKIDSVIVTSSGKVDRVVLDVSSWLQSKKLIAVPWKDLKVDDKGNVTSAMTKEEAKAAAGYTYANNAGKGQVLTDKGDVYQPSAASNAQTSTANSTNSRVINADGSYNASEVVGLEVTNQQNEKVGKIGELLLDQSGRVNGVVVDVGGFLGMGTHPVRLAWKDIMLGEAGKSDQAVVRLSKDQLKALPAYETSSK